MLTNEELDKMKDAYTSKCMDRRYGINFHDLIFQAKEANRLRDLVTLAEVVIAEGVKTALNVGKERDALEEKLELTNKVVELADALRCRTNYMGFGIKQKHDRVGHEKLTEAIEACNGKLAEEHPDLAGV